MNHIYIQLYKSCTKSSIQSSAQQCTSSERMSCFTCLQWKVFQTSTEIKIKISQTFQRESSCLFPEEWQFFDGPFSFFVPLSFANLNREIRGTNKISLISTQTLWPLHHKIKLLWIKQQADASLDPLPFPSYSSIIFNGFSWTSFVYCMLKILAPLSL